MGLPHPNQTAGPISTGYATPATAVTASGFVLHGLSVEARECQPPAAFGAEPGQKPRQVAVRQLCVEFAERGLQWLPRRAAHGAHSRPTARCTARSMPAQSPWGPTATA